METGKNQVMVELQVRACTVDRAVCSLSLRSKCIRRAQSDVLSLLGSQEAVGDGKLIVAKDWFSGCEAGFVSRGNTSL